MTRPAPSAPSPPTRGSLPWLLRGYGRLTPNPLFMRGRNPGARRPIGEMLVERGLLTADQLAAALAAQPASGERLGEILAGLGYVSRTDLFRTLADQLGVPFHDLEANPPDGAIARRLPRDLAERVHAIVVDSNDRGYQVAMADPEDLVALDELRASHWSFKRLEPLLADPEALDAALAAAFAPPAPEPEDEAQAMVDLLERTLYLFLDPNSPVEPTVQIADSILSLAFEQSATAAHLQCWDEVHGQTVVSFRTPEGTKAFFLPLERLHHALVSRFKIMAGMNLAEVRHPQDGLFTVERDGATRDALVCCVPGEGGAKLAITFRPPSPIPLTADEQAALRSAPWATAVQHVLLARAGGHGDDALRAGLAGAGWADAALHELWDLVPPDLATLPVPQTAKSGEGRHPVSGLTDAEASRLGDDYLRDMGAKRA